MRTLILRLSNYRPADVVLRAPYRLRTCHTADAAAIGRLHHCIYGTESLDQTIADFEGSFRGEHGVPVDDASLAVETSTGWQPRCVGSLARCC